MSRLTRTFLKMAGKRSKGFFGVAIGKKRVEIYLDGNDKELVEAMVQLANKYPAVKALLLITAEALKPPKRRNTNIAEKNKQKPSK